MNVIWLVVDSLRASSVGRGTPFLDRLAAETVHFTRAHATECWTLPSHCSMFTGLLPSEHGAHFRTMGYTGRAPTIAELLAAAGWHTEIVTRNSIFDGSMPGVTRGFRRNTCPLSPDGTGLNPLALMLAVSKPRFRRQILSTGFFHPLQRTNREFVTRFARATLPADRLALDYVLERAVVHRRRGERFFYFVNLYDVHAPYAPSLRSIFGSFRSLGGIADNVRAMGVLPYLGGHAYLRPGFRLSEASRRMLIRRYERAIELMDAKLADFHAGVRAAGLLDDTLVVVTSDHGEAFGEHGLYLHDASVFETHLHVPLYVHHPGTPRARVDDVVSTRELFGLVREATLGGTVDDTILAAGYRARHPIALAEHFHYPAPWSDVRFRQDLVAAIGPAGKVVVGRDGARHYDIAGDPAELTPTEGTVPEFGTECRRAGADASAVAAAVRAIEAGARRVAAQDSGASAQPTVSSYRSDGGGSSASSNPPSQRPSTTQRTSSRRRAKSVPSGPSAL